MRALVATLLICAVASTAAAQPSHNKRGHGGGGYERSHGGGHHNRGRHYGGGHHSRSVNDALGGFFGGVLGGWVAQAMRPDREGTDVEGDLEPWSKAWFAYCSDKYRSFNPVSGRYRGYDGDLHFCDGD